MHEHGAAVLKAALSEYKLYCYDAGPWPLVPKVALLHVISTRFFYHMRQSRSTSKHKFHIN
jgi:hypothetical protein